MPSKASTAQSLATAFCLMASVSQGKPGAASAAEQVPKTSACEHENAISAISCELARKLSEHKIEHVVSLTAQWSEPASTRTNSLRSGPLADRIARVVADRLGARSHGSESTPLTHRQKSGRQLVLQPVVKHARLEVTADVFEGRQGFWERAKGQSRTALAHAFSSRRLDAELRSFFKPTPLVVTRIDKAALNEGGTLALACGDLDGDHSLELAIASRHTLRLGRINHERFVTLRTRSLAGLSDVSATPLREPLATLNLVEGSYLDIGITDRTFMTRLSPRLKPLKKLRGVLPWPGAGCARRVGVGVAASSSRCTAEVSAGEHPGVLIDTFASAKLLTQDGKSFQITATRSLEHELRLIDSRGSSLVVSNVGAQIAVGDMNQDGLAEVLVTRNTNDEKNDAVSVYTWSKDGLSPRIELDVPTGVDALALCPPEEVGLSPLAIATGREIWIVR